MVYSDSFCQVYNIFGWNYYPEAFGEQLLLWMKQNRIAAKSSLDLACGTGILCQMLKDHGVDASGMDLSEGMIRIARESRPDIPFDVADMITYCPDKQFDLVTCTGDALNHIHDLADVGKIFDQVCAYLAPGGHFVFDILNENEVSSDEPFDLNFSDTIRAEFQLQKDFGNRMVILTVAVYEDGKFQFREQIREKLHDPARICCMLRERGLEVIKCANQLPDEGNYQGTTWYIIAKKPGIR